MAAQGHRVDRHRVEHDSGEFAAEFEQGARHVVAGGDDDERVDVVLAGPGGGLGSVADGVGGGAAEGDVFARGGKASGGQDVLAVQDLGEIAATDAGDEEAGGFALGEEAVAGFDAAGTAGEDDDAVGGRRIRGQAAGGALELVEAGEP